MIPSALRPPFLPTTGGMLAQDERGRRWFALDLEFSRWLYMRGFPGVGTYPAYEGHVVRAPYTKKMPLGGFMQEDIVWRPKVPDWLEQYWKYYGRELNTIIKP
jgi:hypothetical protein